MKPLVLALTVALFATLLNLGSAGTEAGIKKVASYKDCQEYTKRQFPENPTIACIPATGWNDVDKAEKSLQSIAGGDNDQKKKVPLDKGGMMIKDNLSKNIVYCKFVTGAYAVPTSIGKKGKELMKVSKVPRYEFYAKKAANKSPKTLQATATKVADLVAKEKDPKKRFIKNLFIVEITAANEIYVGPIALNPTAKKN